MLSLMAHFNSARLSADPGRSTDLLWPAVLGAQTQAPWCIRGLPKGGAKSICTVFPLPLKKIKRFGRVIWFQLTGYTRSTHVCRLLASLPHCFECLPVPAAVPQTAGEPPLSGHFPATCGLGPAGGRPPFPERLVSRAHLSGRASPRSHAPGKGRLSPAKLQSALHSRRGPGPQVPVPASARGGDGPAPQAVRSCDGTCCVLKSQPRQQLRVTCSTMALEGPAERPSASPSRGVTAAALQRPGSRARPSPRPAGLWTRVTRRACALAPPAGGQELGPRLAWASGFAPVQ